MPTETERRIFSYHDGKDYAYADPLATQRRIDFLLRGETDQVVKDSNDSNPGVSSPALDRLVSAIREAFVMVPFDRTTGIGATEEDCRRVWGEFAAWQDSKKKSTVTSLPSPPPTPDTLPPLDPWTTTPLSDSP